MGTGKEILMYSVLLKKLVSKLALLAIGGVFAWAFLSQYFSFSASDYLQMLDDDSKVMAVLDEKYTFNHSKYSSYYEFTFKYEVDGIKYDGKYTSGSVPEIPVVSVYYLKSNPKVYSLDPEKSLEDEPGWGTLLVGIISLLVFIYELLTISPTAKLFSQVSKQKKAME